MPPISKFAGGPGAAVRPYCNNKDYWQVYFDSNRVIKETVAAAGFAVRSSIVRFEERR